LGYPFLSIIPHLYLDYILLQKTLAQKLAHKKAVSKYSNQDTAVRLFSWSPIFRESPCSCIRYCFQQHKR